MEKIIEYNDEVKYKLEILELQITNLNQKLEIYEKSSIIVLSSIENLKNQKTQLLESLVKDEKGIVTLNKIDNKDKKIYINIEEEKL